MPNCFLKGGIPPKQIIPRGWVKDYILAVIFKQLSHSIGNFLIPCFIIHKMRGAKGFLPDKYNFPPGCGKGIQGIYGLHIHSFCFRYKQDLVGPLTIYQLSTSVGSRIQDLFRDIIASVTVFMHRFPKIMLVIRIIMSGEGISLGTVFQPEIC